MRPVVILHYHEIALKGGNRDLFERQLVANVRQVLWGIPGVEVRRMSGRIAVRMTEEVASMVSAGDMSAVVTKLRRVFGVANLRVGYEVRADAEGIAEDAVQLVQQHMAARAHTQPKTFAVRVKRSIKTYPEHSMDMERRIGAAVHVATGLGVDLEHPDLMVAIEVVERTAFVLLEKIPGPGGLPVGASDRVLALLSSGFDSPVAAWKLMRRGCVVDCIHFHSYPFTSDASMRNVAAIVQRLANWGGSHVLYFVPLAEFQKCVLTTTPSELRVVLYRRMMIRVAEVIAQRAGALALVTGESVGQVASQTIPNIAAVDAVAGMPVLRPLIGEDKQDIISQATMIGTADISALPYDDCCSLFTPQHPATRARLIDCEAAEHALQVDEWLPRLCAQVTSMRIAADTPPTDMVR
ncbi:tRNA 4-thiouridine(8) synthase ThiI [Candidatus Uhrbacteria bacterium]|nr:tRNA 4-thiouridine(8) synthase ThiI [Candidatus Uhrbacteria bacterium]